MSPEIHVGQRVMLPDNRIGTCERVDWGGAWIRVEVDGIPGPELVVCKPTDLLIQVQER